MLRSLFTGLKYLGMYQMDLRNEIKCGLGLNCAFFALITCLDFQACQDLKALRLLLASKVPERESLLHLGRRTVNLRRPERARDSSVQEHFAYMGTSLIRNSPS